MFVRIGATFINVDRICLARRDGDTMWVDVAPASSTEAGRYKFEGNEAGQIEKAIIEHQQLTEEFIKRQRMFIR
jgi:hypothetical protein